MAHGSTTSLRNGLTAYEVKIASGSSDASAVAALGASKLIRVPRGWLTITGANDAELRWKTEDGSDIAGVIEHKANETTRVAIEPTDELVTATANKALLLTRSATCAITGRLDVSPKVVSS